MCVSFLLAPRDKRARTAVALCFSWPPLTKRRLFERLDRILSDRFALFVLSSGGALLRFAQAGDTGLHEYIPRSFCLDRLPIAA